jgi:hypothetical protein
MKKEKFSPPFEEYKLGFIWLLHSDMKKKETFACFPETKYFHFSKKINVERCISFSRQFCFERESGGGVGFCCFQFVLAKFSLWVIS